ncbi:uncharacterized protein V6R79_002764 [Siganus canaliculatus]
MLEAEISQSDQGDSRERTVQVEKMDEIEKHIIPQRIASLQRDLSVLVTNIQTVADAKQSARRIELEEAREFRQQRLESDVQSSQEKFEEITEGWVTAKQKVITQELREFLDHQQQLCTALIEDKKKLIHALQQEMKIRDDNYVQDLRKQAEDLDLMMERMDDQIKTLKNAYREELTHTERVFQQESEALFTEDMTEWEKCMEQFRDQELEKLTQRRQKVKECQAKICNVIFEIADNYDKHEADLNAQFQMLERNLESTKASVIVTGLKIKKQQDQKAQHSIYMNCMKSRIKSLQAEKKMLEAKNAKQEKEFARKCQCLSEDYKRSMQGYDRILRKSKTIVAADTNKFEEMWLMLEAEVKHLVEKVLVIDSMICQKHFGLAWEQPPMPFMDQTGPIKPKKQGTRRACRTTSQSFQTGRFSQSGPGMTDASFGSQLETESESTGVEMYKESESSSVEEEEEEDEEKLSIETVKRVTELLCDEMGFLMDDELQNLLLPLEKEEQTVVKLTSLLCSIGLRENDVPKFARFLMRHKHQKEQSEDACAESSEGSNLLEQLALTRENSASQHPNFHLEARDDLEDEAFWQSMAHIISEDKVKLWEAAEKILLKHHAVLTEISELVPEIQSLEQQNREMQMLLQQSLNSRV